MKHSPTAEQQAIIDAVALGKSLKVAALAGTGKTSTLQFIADAYPNRRGLYLAYNKALQIEARKKFPAWVDCKTVHGLAYQKEGFKFVGQLNEKADYGKIIRGLTIEDFKATFALSPESNKKATATVDLSAGKQVALAREIIRFFTFSKEYAIEPQRFTSFLSKKLANLNRSLFDGTIDIEKEKVDKCFTHMIEKILTETQRIWGHQKSPQSDLVPASHDTYLKTYQISQPTIEGYDYIMLDEAQDANPCILDILANQTCQIIYVGDQNQQIYEFRGTVNAMQTLDIPVFYLTQSFRFGRAIADQANIALKMLGGKFLIKGLDSINSKVETITSVPYTFLGRTNSMLFAKCIEAIQDGYRCTLVCDIKETIALLRAVFLLWRGKPELVKDARVITFKTWEALAAYVDDEEDAELDGAMKLVGQYTYEIPDLLNLIEESGRFPENEADIVFSTAHRSKGREWDNVIIADDFTLKTDQDKNLYYVALTRAKKILDHEWPVNKNDETFNRKTTRAVVSDDTL